MKSEQFIRWCDTVMVFCLCAAIYFVSISIALLEIFSYIALVFYFLKRTIIMGVETRRGKIGWRRLSFLGKLRQFLRAYKPIENCLNRPITVLLIFSFVSVLTSQYPAVSWKGFLGKPLAHAFLYFNFIECFNSRERLKKFLTVFFASASVVSLSGLYQSFFGRDLIFGHIAYDGRISSSFRAHNDFGAYLILVIPVLLSLTIFPWWEKKNASDKTNGLGIFFENPKIKIWLFLLLSLTLYDVGLTFSRGAWLGLIVSLIIFGARNRQILKILALIFVCSFIFVLIAKDPRFIFKDLKEIFIDNGRIYYWKEATNIIQHYLIFGAGLNAYSLVGRDYKITWGGYPHNCYLQMAAETGLVGLAAFIWMLIVLFRNSFKISDRMESFSLKIVLNGFLIGLLGFLIHSFFDTVLYSVQLSSLMWIYMGVIVAIPKIAQHQEKKV